MICWHFPEHDNITMVDDVIYKEAVEITVLLQAKFHCYLRSVQLLDMVVCTEILQSAIWSFSLVCFQVYGEQ